MNALPIFDQKNFDALGRVLIDAFHPTAVRKELMKLSVKHTDAKVSIVELTDGILGIKALPDEDLRPFYAEFERLENLISEPLREPILSDDHPVHQGYLYVANDKVTEFIDGMNMTVGKWKALRIPNVAPVNEVRRCDIPGRQARRPLKKEPESIFKGAWDKAGPTIKQARRKPRSSNKIKKVS